MNILQIESAIWVLLIFAAFVVSGSALLLVYGLSVGYLLAIGAHSAASRPPSWFAKACSHFLARKVAY